MNVKNLFRIEELLECMADNYCHVIIWFNDKVERENLWQLIYRAVDIKGDESLKVWFYTSKKDEPIMIIPIEF